MTIVWYWNIIFKDEFGIFYKVYINTTKEKIDELLVNCYNNNIVFIINYDIAFSEEIVFNNIDDVYSTINKYLLARNNLKEATQNYYKLYKKDKETKLYLYYDMLSDEVKELFNEFINFRPDDISDNPKYFYNRIIDNKNNKIEKRRNYTIL